MKQHECLKGYFPRKGIYKKRIKWHENDMTWKKVSIGSKFWFLSFDTCYFIKMFYGAQI